MVDKIWLSLFTASSSVCCFRRSCMSHKVSAAFSVQVISRSIPNETTENPLLEKIFPVLTITS